MKLPSIKGERVLIRVDYNVPIVSGRVRDPKRIEASYQSIDAVLKKWATPVLIAHLGDGQESLRPIATFLSKKYKIVFITHDILDRSIDQILDQVPSGAIILLENIRRYKEEEANSPAFAKLLAKLGKFYINDAFSVCHRPHASIVGIPKYLPSTAGFQLEFEIKSLKAAFMNKKHPFVFILGGAKFKTKIPLLKQFAEKADKLVIAGALLNNFYKVSNFEVGKSVTEEGYDLAIKKLLKNEKLLLPIDVVVVGREKSVVVGAHEVEKTDTIVDIGPQSIRLISAEIKKAKLVVWNGPTGWYERGYTKGTKALAKAIAESNATAIIGGGDTGAVVDKIKSKGKADGENKNIFISTGGGATLDYLSNGTLPGIKALKI